LARAIAGSIKEGTYPYRLDQVKSRGKSIDSVRTRLEEKGVEGSKEIEKHRKDLAGW